jgi:hypothetical protein
VPIDLEEADSQIVSAAAVSVAASVASAGVARRPLE